MRAWQFLSAMLSRSTTPTNCKRSRLTSTRLSLNNQVTPSREWGDSTLNAIRRMYENSRMMKIRYGKKNDIFSNIKRRSGRWIGSTWKECVVEGVEEKTCWRSEGFSILSIRVLCVRHAFISLILNIWERGCLTNQTHTRKLHATNPSSN